MSQSLFRCLFAVIALLVLAGCSKPETPQQVAEAFWQAVAENDADAVAELSTLSSPDDFDGFRKDWTGIEPSYGRVVIDEREATVVTRLPPEYGKEGEHQELITFLIKEAETWQVDYDRTEDALLRPSMFGNLMGELNKLGEKLSSSFASSSDDIEASMNEFARNFEAYSAEVERKTRDAVEDFGALMQQAIEKLQESINEALEQGEQATPEDRVILEQASRSLSKEVESLEEPTMETLAQASRTLAETGERFTQLSTQTYNRYKDDWEAQLEEIRAETNAFFADLRESLTAEG
ncbi:SNARE domain-containing protein [Marinobacter similis]|uniref:DUF4878 domain-containing protein n=1 Tax=Marinobacter similis TaxID=1420916 RepID=W5YG88_9GAMM|nr:hypothetical protein [Marinobacter similis]AHI28096.1 hypothetical protein AU14_04095 [Marinobacter similis]